MPIDFPNNPAVNDIYAYSGVSWQWNGYAWDSISVGGVTGGVTGATGPAGATGATGPAGAANAAGITGSIQYKDGSGFSGNSQMYWDGTNLVIDTTAHLDGDILGGVHHYAHNNSGVGITKGWPVYISGMDGASTIIRIAGADASNSSKMPAVGLAEETIANGNFGHIVMFGTLLQTDTSSYSTNQTLYVSPGGGLTATRPVGSGNLIQNIGKVGRVHSNTGSIVVMGPGRSNDVPNVVDVRSWLLMPNGQTATSIVTTFNGLSGPVTGVTTSISNTFIPIQLFSGGITTNGITSTGDIIHVGSGSSFISDQVVLGSVNGSNVTIGTSGYLTSAEISVAADEGTVGISAAQDITIGTANGVINFVGNLNITGQILVNGAVITKTGFYGFTGDTDEEPVDYVTLDGGEF